MSRVPKFNSTIIALIVGLFATTLIFVAKCDPNTNPVIVLCNDDSYTNGDPFGDSLAYVLMDLLTETPSCQGFDYGTVSPYPNAVAYGHTNCNNALNNNDCANCLVSAKATLSGFCSGRIGGQVQLIDCFIRYESYPF